MTDLFVELLDEKVVFDEKMIFDMIIDLTYDRQEYVEAEGSFGEMLAILKVSAQSESEEEPYLRKPLRDIDVNA